MRIINTSAEAEQSVFRIVTKKQTDSCVLTSVWNTLLLRKVDTYF